MNYHMVWRLVWKDWYLYRWAILSALAGGAATLALIATGGSVAFYFGVVLLVTLLIAAGAYLAGSTTVNERKEQTLAFVMSLPISYREYTAAKLLANLLIFLIPWVLLAAGSIALLLLSPKTYGLVPYTAIMATEILVSTCFIVTVAVISESQGWMISAIMLGNLALNGVGYLGRSHPQHRPRDAGPQHSMDPGSLRLAVRRIRSRGFASGFHILLSIQEEGFPVRNNPVSHRHSPAFRVGAQIYTMRIGPGYRDTRESIVNSVIPSTPACATSTLSNGSL